MNSDVELLFKDKVLGHPAGLFVLFFTEMWERFSYYGMRALLVMFFTASLLDNGWGWPREHAFAIFGTYTSLVYLSIYPCGGLYGRQENWLSLCGSYRGFIDDDRTCMYGARITIFYLFRFGFLGLW